MYGERLLANMDPIEIERLQEDILTVLAANEGRVSKSDLMAVLRGGSLTCTLNRGGLTRRWSFGSRVSSYDLCDAAAELGFTVERKRRKDGTFIPSAWVVSL